MSEHESHACPNCGRKLTESEVYCYFCEIDLSKLEKKEEKKHKKH